jgi:hypothetical protein
MLRPPLSRKVYISFSTMSVVSPTPRTNNSVASNIGVRISPYPNRPAISRAFASSSFHAADSGGKTSLVPRGAAIGSITGRGTTHRAGRPRPPG